MKSTIFASLGLLGLSTALPAATEIERTLPAGWLYKISSLKGPGCPDFGADPEKVFATRLTYGQNTMDGTEVYYWFVAYPHLHVDLADNDSSWCETELSYEEYSNYDAKTPSADYRLRLHKNGTRAIATYDLEKGVSAKIEFEYDAGKGEEVSFPILCRSLKCFYRGYLHEHPATPSIHRLTFDFLSTVHRHYRMDRPNCIRPVPERVRLCVGQGRYIQAPQVWCGQDKVQD